MYCSSDKSYTATAYSNADIHLVNRTEFYKKDNYAPNESLANNIQLMYKVH